MSVEARSQSYKKNFHAGTLQGIDEDRPVEKFMVKMEAEGPNRKKEAVAIQDTIGYILRSPIRCHYLMMFCRKEFNTENVGFLIKVSLFREIMEEDKALWPKSWREVDKSISVTKEIKSNWPSTIVEKELVVKAMNQIYEEFLDQEDAPEPICIDTEMLRRTKNRIELVDFYGPDVFTEASLDPIKTVKRDILPRFCVSNLHSQMLAHINALPRTMTEFTDGALECLPEVEVSVPIEKKVIQKKTMQDHLGPAMSHVINVYNNVYDKAQSALGFDVVEGKQTKLLKSLLSRQLWTVVPKLLLLNLFLNVILGLDYYYSDTPVCNDPYVFESWVWIVDYTICVCFILTVVLNLNRLISSRGQLSHELSAALVTNICTGLMAGTANVLTVAFNYGGTCRDMFGVQTPATQWPEWFTTVPYLIYTAVAVENKQKLDSSDIGVIFAMAMCILTGALLNLPLPMGVAIGLLVVSCVCMLAVVAMVVRVQRANREVIDENDDKMVRAHKIAIAAQSRNLAWLCLVGMPVLPLLYFLRVFDVLSVDSFYAGNNIMSCLIKVVFASMAAEGHMATAQIMYKALESDAEAAHEAEAFAEHLFQRVTIPLKAVIAGLEMMEDGEQQDDGLILMEYDQVRTLRNTTVYIHDNVTELLQADRSKIRKEDALRLLVVSFNVKSYLQTVLQGMQSLMRERLITCKMDVKSDVPVSMIGDVARLEHVLTTLLSTGLRAAAQKTRMSLCVYAKKYRKSDDSDLVRPFNTEEFMDNDGDNASSRRSSVSSQAPSRMSTHMSSKASQAPRASVSMSNRLRGPIRAAMNKRHKKKLFSFCVEVSRSAPLGEVEDIFFLHDGERSMEADQKKRYAGSAHRELSLAREIVVLHGGSVYWSSKGKSTTIGFAIPYELVDGKVSTLSVS